MATAKLVTLAEEVKDKLKTNAWSITFDPVRTYRPNPKLEETDQLTVLVVMAATRTNPDSRNEWVYEHDIDIGILFRAKPDAGNATEKFDECLALQEEIADYYRHRRATGADMVLFAVNFGAGAGQPYIPEHINESNQFTGVVRLTFREYRS